MEWISVDDKLPKHHDIYLAVNEHNGVWIYFYHATLNEWTDIDDEPMPKVTHWMPLPQPPEGL